MEPSEAANFMVAALRMEVESRHKKFKWSADAESQVAQFLAWLTSQSPQFGVIMCGNCGNGKTTLVKAFQRLLNFLNIKDEWYNMTHSIQIITAKEIVQLYKTDYQAWNRLVHKPMLAIDDLGTEATELIDFGNPITPIIDALTIRYDAQLVTLMTTNLTSQKMAAKYGERLIDRLNEMCVKIVFKNESYRRQ